MDRFEIHAHSVFSNIRLLDCINKIADLIQTAYDKGLSGVTLTDHEFVGNAVEFLAAERDLKEKGKIAKDFVCALGNEIYLVKDREKEKVEKYYHFILIAKNSQGHEALRKLSSFAWLNSYYHRGIERVPTTYAELVSVLEEYPDSLIGSSACLGSEFAKLTNDLIIAEKAGDYQIEKEKVKQFLEFWSEKFKGNFYIEIAPSTSRDQIIYNKRAIKLGREFNVPVIIGSDAHYCTKEDRFVHKAYLTSTDGEREVDEFYSSTYLMDEEEVRDLTKEYIKSVDLEEIFNNSLNVMRQIEGYSINNQPIIPFIAVPDRDEALGEMIPEYCPTLRRLDESDNLQENYWLDACVESLIEKGLDKKEEYWRRLEEEADVTCFIQEKMNNCLFAYFNTFKHFIDLFWDCGSIVGPGRGSAVCFLSNYLLGITQLDPIEWATPLWRFLNKERVELPKNVGQLKAGERFLAVCA